RLRALARAGCMTDDALSRALALSTATPDATSWRRFLGRILLVLGSLLLVAGVVFFFAYNWSALSRLTRIALLEATVIAAALASLRLGLERLSGRILLAAAALLVGPLLAVYGQAYQTGADPYELFAGWALLILPWVGLARLAPLALLPVALI